MHRLFDLAFLLLLCLCPPGQAAGCTVQSFDGVWRFDPERTRAVCGDKAAAIVKQNMPDTRVEISIISASEGSVRVYVDTSGAPEQPATPVSTEIAEGGLTLRNQAHGDLFLRAVDADTLAARSNDGLNAVLVRVNDDFESISNN